MYCFLSIDSGRSNVIQCLEVTTIKLTTIKDGYSCNQYTPFPFHPFDTSSADSTHTHIYTTHTLVSCPNRWASMSAIVETTKFPS